MTAILAAFVLAPNGALWSRPLDPLLFMPGPHESSAQLLVGRSWLLCDLATGKTRLSPSPPRTPVPPVGNVKVNGQEGRVIYRSAVMTVAVLTRARLAFVPRTGSPTILPLPAELDQPSPTTKSLSVVGRPGEGAFGIIAGDHFRGWAGPIVGGVYYSRVGEPAPGKMLDQAGVLRPRAHTRYDGDSGSYFLVPLQGCWWIDGGWLESGAWASGLKWTSPNGVSTEVSGIPQGSDVRFAAGHYVLTEKNGILTGWEFHVGRPKPKVARSVSRFEATKVSLTGLTPAKAAIRN